MTNRPPLRAPSLLQNQAGLSSINYLLIIACVGAAGFSALWALGGSSHLAIAGKAASAATPLPLLTGHNAAAEDEVEMQVGIAPSEIEGDPGAAGSTGAGAAGEGELSIDDDGTIRDAAGNVLGSMDENGVISVDGQPVAQLNPDGSITEIAPAEVAGGEAQTGSLVPGAQAGTASRSAEFEGAESNGEDMYDEDGGDGGGGLGMFGKIVTGVALVAGGAAIGFLGAATAPFWAPVAGIAIAGVGAWGLVETFTGKDHSDEPVVEAPTEGTPSEQTPTGEIAPESGALDGQAPLMTLESLGITAEQLVEVPYDVEVPLMSNNPSELIFEYLGVPPGGEMTESTEILRTKLTPVTYADGSVGYLSTNLRPMSQNGLSWVGEATVLDAEGNLLTDENGNSMGAPISITIADDYLGAAIQMVYEGEDGSQQATPLIDVRIEKQGQQGVYVTTYPDGEEVRSEPFEFGTASGQEFASEYYATHALNVVLASLSGKELQSIGETEESYQFSEEVDGVRQTVLMNYNDDGESYIAVDQRTGHVTEWQFAASGEVDSEGFPVQQLVSLRAAKLPEQQ